MTPDEILHRVGEQLGVRRVFGEPVEHDGVVIVPVAVATGGGGAGTGPGPESGAGLGGMVRAVGVYAVSNGRVRFVPVIDTTALAAVGLAAVGLLLYRARRHRG